MMRIYKITDYGVISNFSLLQTEKIQAVLDLCREGGGTVVIPAGNYRVSSLYMHSDTTLKLERGARLLGSEECGDYTCFPVPEGVILHTDRQLLRGYWDKPNWHEYRRAMISAYGERNLSIIGEEGAVIDGCDCYDPEGEENMRGPHGIFFSNCENITLEGYTIRNSGNFMHQLDTCRRVNASKLKVLAGHDGFHLHFCRDVSIKDCIIHSGDDCVAGIHVQKLLVKGCDLNTSCNPFRLGGNDILIEDCSIIGPGYYPHRLTTVRGKGDYLPREGGRHNTLVFMEYFAHESCPQEKPCDALVRDCYIDGIESLLGYLPGENFLNDGTPLAHLRFERVTIRNLGQTSRISSHPNQPLTIELSEVDCGFSDGGQRPLFDARGDVRIVRE